MTGTRLAALRTGSSTTSRSSRYGCFRSLPCILYDPHGVPPGTPGVAANGSDGMKFFVDTADTAEIKSLAASGLLDGVTTNPSLMAKTGKKFQDVLAEICATIPGP